MTDVEKGRHDKCMKLAFFFFFFFYGDSCSLCQLASEMLKGLCGWLTSVPGLFGCSVALQWWMASVKYFDCGWQDAHVEMLACVTQQG